MTVSRIALDDRGVTLDASLGDSFDVFCDDHHVWSFSLPEGAAGETFVRWPDVMRRFLDGVAVFRVEAAGEVLYDRETRFGAGEERIAFRDKAGIPIMIDKWGLIQRPFTGRGRGVIERMVEVTDDILRILEAECGVRAWIAFGTLLGAARSGKVIGHDSDIDLAYVSEQATPAAMAREMYEMTRALRRHGMRVLPKSGSFITVVFPAPDGGSASIDIYTCLYVGDLLHETATVRAAVPRSAIEPLRTMTFEGRELAAPADPDALLVASYGPNWRTPDPSFKHQPGPEIVDRFDGWFGSLMRNRRDWERALRTHKQEEGLTPSDFAGWVADRLPAGTSVVEVGSGLGSDALLLGDRGHAVVALDYARGVTKDASRKARRKDLPVTFEQVNLYELRDVLTEAAVLARTLPTPRALVARQLLGALAPDGVENFWRLAATMLRDGGTAYLEIAPSGRGRPEAAPGVRTRRFPVTAAGVERQARAAGASRVVREAAGTAEEPLVRMTIEWKDRA